MDTSAFAAPLIRNVPGRGLPRQVRRSLDDGRTVVLLSKRDTELRRVLADLGGLEPTVNSVRLGDGRTATMLRAEGTPAPFSPYAWWPRQDPQPAWRWACRACGTVDERWSWPEQEGGEAVRMVRYAVDPDDLDGPWMAVPWTCPRGTCHGAPRWLLVEPTASGTSCGTGTPSTTKPPTL